MYPAPAPQVSKWNQVENELLEAKADTIDATLIALDNLNGMFIHTSEMGGLLERTKVLLQVEVSNLRSAVTK